MGRVERHGREHGANPARLPPSQVARRVVGPGQPAGEQAHRLPRQVPGPDGMFYEIRNYVVRPGGTGLILGAWQERRDAARHLPASTGLTPVSATPARHRVSWPVPNSGTGVEPSGVPSLPAASIIATVT